MAESVMDDHEIKQMNDYAMSKWVNEMQIRNSRIQNNTESVVVRLFNTYGPGEYYSPYRSVNCRFLYCALHGLPWVVFRGHERTSTYLADTVRTLANISENFIPGETYNIGGNQEHTIETLSDVILEVTGADPSLVEYRDSEILTTKAKKVDTSKSHRDLDHKNSYSLEEGLRLTADWMRGRLQSPGSPRSRRHSGFPWRSVTMPAGDTMELVPAVTAEPKVGGEGRVVVRKETPRVLLLSGAAPGDAGVGELFLRDLCRFLPDFAILARDRQSAWRARPASVVLPTSRGVLSNGTVMAWGGTASRCHRCPPALPAM